MRLLIDHTTAHTLNLKNRARDWEAAARALLQFVEELCAADQLWISDTEGGETLQVSTEVRETLEHGGLKASDGAPLLRTAVVSDYEFKTMVLPRAARGLYGTLYRMGGAGDLQKKLRMHGEAAGEIRASVHAAESIPDLIRRVRTSAVDRDTLVSELADDKERGSAAALLLLDPALERLADKLITSDPEPTSPTYVHLHLLSRWHINLQLAMFVSTYAGSNVQYAPAYSRATVLAGYLPKRVANLHLLERQLWDKFGQYGAVKYGRDLPEAATLPIPLIGAAVLLSLPANATLSDLIAAIGEFRTTAVGVAIRDLLSERRSALDINVVTGKLAKRLGLPKAAGSLKARFTLMTTPPFAKGEVVAEKDLSAHGAYGIGDVLAYLYSAPDVTVLTSFFEELFQEEALESQVVNRSASILGLAG